MPGSNRPLFHAFGLNKPSNGCQNFTTGKYINQVHPDRYWQNISSSGKPKFFLNKGIKDEYQDIILPD
jgi:hypothetical protein